MGNKYYEEKLMTDGVDDKKFDSFIKNAMSNWHHARNLTTMNEDLEKLMTIVELQNEIIKHLVDDFDPHIGKRLKAIEEQFATISKK